MALEQYYFILIIISSNFFDSLIFINRWDQYNGHSLKPRRLPMLNNLVLYTLFYYLLNFMISIWRLDILSNEFFNSLYNLCSLLLMYSTVCLITVWNATYYNLRINIFLLSFQNFRTLSVQFWVVSLINCSDSS